IKRCRHRDSWPTCTTILLHLLVLDMGLECNAVKMSDCVGFGFSRYGTFTIRIALRLVKMGDEKVTLVCLLTILAMDCSLVRLLVLALSVWHLSQFEELVPIALALSVRQKCPLALKGSVSFFVQA
ncbi:unnamed protein product, partial [Prunus brigantina]